MASSSQQHLHPHEATGTTGSISNTNSLSHHPHPSHPQEGSDPTQSQQHPLHQATASSPSPSQRGFISPQGVVGGPQGQPPQSPTLSYKDATPPRQSLALQPPPTVLDANVPVHVVPFDGASRRSRGAGTGIPTVGEQIRDNKVLTLSLGLGWAFWLIILVSQAYLTARLPSIPFTNLSFVTFGFLLILLLQLSYLLFVSPPPTLIALQPALPPSRPISYHAPSHISAAAVGATTTTFLHPLTPYHHHLSLLAVVTLVFAILGVDTTVHGPYPATLGGAYRALAAGNILIALLAVFWLFWFSAPPGTGLPALLGGTPTTDPVIGGLEAGGAVGGTAPSVGGTVKGSVRQLEGVVPQGPNGTQSQDFGAAPVAIENKPPPLQTPTSGRGLGFWLFGSKPKTPSEPTPPTGQDPNIPMSTLPPSQPQHQPSPPPRLSVLSASSKGLVPTAGSITATNSGTDVAGGDEEGSEKRRSGWSFYGREQQRQRELERERERQREVERERERQGLTRGKSKGKGPGDGGEGQTYTPMGSPPVGTAPLVTGAKAGDRKYPRAEALFSYTAAAEDPNELSFKKGEILEITDRSGKWWEARHPDGRSGIAPSNYLRLIA